jgi:hypothetical protein
MTLDATTGAFGADPANSQVHDVFCCWTRKCHAVCSHLCGTAHYLGGDPVLAPRAVELRKKAWAERDGAARLMWNEDGSVRP